MEEKKVDIPVTAEPNPKKYIKKVDPTEGEVNILLDLGYTLSAITAISQEFMKNNIYKSIDSQLVYHFLWKGATKK